jgi:hypothetical protein
MTMSINIKKASTKQASNQHQMTMILIITYHLAG